MNTVSITFEPMKRYASISIDGEHISPYSDLAGCENKDLHICAKRLLKLLDEEIGGEYRLEVTGSQFQIDLLTALSKQADFCVGVHGTPARLAFGLDGMISFASEINSRYSLGVEQDTCVHIGGDAVARVKSIYAVRDGSAEVYVMNQIPESAEKGRTVLLVSDHFDIANTRGTNIVEVPAGYIDPFIGYCYYYTKVIPFIENVFAQSKFAKLTKTDALLLEVYTTQSPKYLFDVEKTALDVGETASFTFRVLPESASELYRLQIDRPDAVRIEGDTLTAVQGGTVTLSVFDRSGKLCESRQLSIAKHTYVTSLRLVPSATTLEVGKRGHIDVYPLPENAEDAHSLEWSSSDPDVLYVTSAGEMIALKQGKAIITVSGSRCRKQTSVDVRPALEKMTISQTAVKLLVHQSSVLECEMHPKDAAYESIVWEMSNSNMGTIDVSSDGKTCEFTAGSSFAVGSLKCSAKGTDKFATCTVEVRTIPRPTGLVTCAIIFSLLGIFSSFLIPLFWYLELGILGFFVDIFLPVGIILSLVGKAKHGDKEKAFITMLIIDIIVTILMFIFAVACCAPGSL